MLLMKGILSFWRSTSGKTQESLSIPNLNMREKFEKVWLKGKKLFSETIMDEIFETNFRFHVKFEKSSREEEFTRKVRYLGFSIFFSSIGKIFFFLGGRGGGD